MATLTYDFNSDSVTGANLQTSLDELNTALTSLTDANFKAGAAIAASRLGTITVNVTYQVPLIVQSQITGGWPASGVVGFVPIEEDVILTGGIYACNDCGGGAGVADLEWGYFDGSGTWVTISTLETISFTDKGGGTSRGNLALSDTTLTSGTGVRCVALVATTADATMLVGNDGRFLVVTLNLKKSVTV